MQLPIPDLPAERKLYLLCWPDNVFWRALLDGFVTSPTRGRFWDASTGNIKEVQAFAQEAITLMDCEELITVLGQIRDAVSGLEAANVSIAISNSATAQSASESAAAAQASADAQVALNQVMVQVAVANAVASAWSQAVSTSVNIVNIRNQVEVTLPPYSPLDPPDSSGIIEAGYTTTPPASSLELCGRAVYLVDSSIYLFEQLYLARKGIRNYSYDAALGLLEGLLTALFYKFGLRPPPLVLGKVAQMAMALSLTSLLDAAVDQTLADAYNNLVGNRDILICAIWNAANEDLSTPAIREVIFSVIFLNDTTWRPLLWAYLDLSLLGILYLTPTGQDWSGVTSNECNVLCGE
jgi:hypothetical protein